MTMPQPQVVDHRYREMEDWANRRLFHPLAMRLARLLAPHGVSPNVVSFLGFLCIITAALCFTRLEWPFSAIAGIAFHLLWHVFDGADGDLARLSGKAGFTGELVDGVCDYAGHIVLYGALAASLADSMGAWAWGLAALAGAAHIAQTNFAETLRRSYLWLAYGKPWLQQAANAQHDALKSPTWFNMVFGWVLVEYLHVAAATAPQQSKLDSLFEEIDDTALLARLRNTVRARAAAILRFTPLLGSNIRTFLLAISMLIGSPLWFFLAECIPLSILLVIAIGERGRVLASLEADLQRLIEEARIARKSGTLPRQGTRRSEVAEPQTTSGPASAKLILPVVRLLAGCVLLIITPIFAGAMCSPVYALAAPAVLATMIGCLVQGYTGLRHATLSLASNAALQLALYGSAYGALNVALIAPGG